jgi:hypothetical protein
VEKLHKELNGLNSSSNIFQVIKSRRTRWAGNVASMGRGEVFSGVWWENLRERDHLEHPGMDGWIILRWIFKKWDVGVGLSFWRSIGTGCGNL